MMCKCCGMTYHSTTDATMMCSRCKADQLVALALVEKEAIDSINMEMATEVRRLTAENEDLTKHNCLLREENIRLKEYEDFYSKIKMENKDLQETLNLALKAYLTQLQLQTTKTIVVTKESKNENEE